MLAPTVIIHGERFEADLASGPEFPAEHTTIIPFLTAWNAPMEMPSSK